MSYILKEQNSDFVFKSQMQEKPTIPNKAPRCPWTNELHKTEVSPHSKWDWKPNPSKVLPSILATVGNTPMVKLNKISEAEKLECEIYGKCEFLNPVGSVKDRMVLRCVEDAERSGVLKPGSTIIEGSSGNTGIALAWISAIKGYRCIIVLPDKIAKEKEYLIRAFGAEVVRARNSGILDSEDAMFGKVHFLHKQIPNSIILDQFSNPSNPLTHYDTTAEEIYDQCNGKVDMIVLGSGTGGTLTGISRKFKEISPNTIIIAADPYGSITAQPEEINKTDVKFIEIEGIGYIIVPTTCDRSMVDKWYKFHDKDALNMARRLIREEGLLVGTSSGVIMAAALKAVKDFDMGKGKTVVVLLPDGTKNYLTKFVSDQWMEQRSFMPCINAQNHWWWDISVTELDFKPFQTISVDTTFDEVLQIMDKFHIDYLPVANKENIIGVAVRRDIINTLISSGSPTDEVATCIERIYSKLPKNSNVGLVSRVLEKETYVVILDSADGVDKAIGMLTSDDVLRFIQNKTPIPIKP